MNFYEQHCLPHLLNFACGMKTIRQQRAEIVPLATGRVLEVGMGSGLNIPYYDKDKVTLVWGLEPSAGMRKKAESKLRQAPFAVKLLDLPGEEIPLGNNSVDTVLLTFTLCTIPDWHKALLQMRRVLKPGGELVFCEHGKAPDKSVHVWQNRINPYWCKIAGGCNLNRPIPDLIEKAGFNIQKIESQYRPGPKFANYFYQGVAN